VVVLYLGPLGALGIDTASGLGMGEAWRVRIRNRALLESEIGSVFHAVPVAYEILPGKGEACIVISQLQNWLEAPFSRVLTPRI